MEGEFILNVFSLIIAVYLQKNAIILSIDIFIPLTKMDCMLMSLQ